MPSAYSRDDVQTHPTGISGPSLPAVNVKVYDSLSDGFRAFARTDSDADPRFDEDWVHAHVSEETLDGLFWLMCRDGFEMIESYARELFGPDVNVWEEGRSGGWAVVEVEGLDDLEDWDAIALARWRRFEKYAKAEASDVMYHMVWSLYHNDYLHELKRGRALHRSRSMLAP